MDETTTQASLYACLMQANPQPPPQSKTPDELRLEHGAYLRTLETTGALVASGPLRDSARRAEDVGTGLLILRAESLSEAERLVADEPYTRDGARLTHVTPWDVTARSLKVQARFGTGTLGTDSRIYRLAQPD